VRLALCVFAPWREKMQERTFTANLDDALALVADFNDALALVSREVDSNSCAKSVFRPLRLGALARKKCKKEHPPRSRGFQ
jgi:hypothetical protein